MDQTPSLFNEGESVSVRVCRLQLPRSCLLSQLLGFGLAAGIANIVVACRDDEFAFVFDLRRL